MEWTPLYKVGQVRMGSCFPYHIHVHRQIHRTYIRYHINISSGQRSVQIPPQTQQELPDSRLVLHHAHLATTYKHDYDRDKLKARSTAAISGHLHRLYGKTRLTPHNRSSDSPPIHPIL